MNIRARINARKIVLTYFYEKYLAQELSKKDNVLSEVIAIDKHIAFRKSEDAESERSDFLDKLQNYYTDDFRSDIDYIIANVFDRQAEDGVDLEYVEKVGTKYDHYKDVIAEKVNKHTSTFTYDQMDSLDRMIFLLGYIEFQEIKTPKEILLNEMIELAKKYGDDGSAKLINGILHKIITEEMEQS